MTTLYYAAKGKKEIATFNRETAVAFARENGITQLAQAETAEREKVRIAVIRDGRKMAGIRVLDLKDDGYHEMLGEMVNSWYVNGTYKVKDLTVR